MASGAAAPQGGAPAAPGTGGAAAGAALQGFKFDAGRLSQTDKITGIASLVLLISLFLPWFSWSVGVGAVHYGGSVSGMSVHGYLWLVFLLSLGIVAFIVFSAGFDRLPFQLPVAKEMMLLVAAGINLLLVLIGFFVNGVSLATTGVGWSFGAFIALIAAIVACVPLALPLIKSRTNRA